MLIETDVLVGALNPADPVNGTARKVLRQGPLLLSPFSLLELNLLSRARKLEIKNFGNFAKDLSALLITSSITTLNDRSEYHSEANRLESRFKLSFFDSLHGAVSKVQRQVIVSFDKTYDRLADEGITRIDPKDV